MKKSQKAAVSAYNKRHGIKRISIAAKPDLQEKWGKLIDDTGLSQTQLLEMLITEYTAARRD